jgi:hypothetical protein
VCLASAAVLDALNGKSTIAHNLPEFSHLPLSRVRSITAVHRALLQRPLQWLWLAVAWCHLSLVVLEPDGSGWIEQALGCSALRLWQVTVGAECVCLVLHAVHTYARFYSGGVRGARLAVPIGVWCAAALDTAYALLQVLLLSRAAGAQAGAEAEVAGAVVMPAGRVVARLCRPYFLICYSRLLKESCETVLTVRSTSHLTSSHPLRTTL